MDQRTALIAELVALLRAIAEEQWALAAEQSRLLQRQGQLAEATNRLTPLAAKIVAEHKRKAAPVAAEAA